MLAIGLCITLLPLALVMAVPRFKQWRQPKYRAYRRLARTLAACGVERQPGETLRQATQRALLLPSTRIPELEAQLSQFETAWYGCGKQGT